MNDRPSDGRRNGCFPRPPKRNGRPRRHSPLDDSEGDRSAPFDKGLYARASGGLYRRRGRGRRASGSAPGGKNGARGEEREREKVDCPGILRDVPELLGVISEIFSINVRRKGCEISRSVISQEAQLHTKLAFTQLLKHTYVVKCVAGLC